MFNDIVEKTKNPFRTGSVLFITLFAMFLLFPEVWLFLSDTFFSYIIADGVFKLLIVGGDGIFQLRVWDNKTKSHGHAYGLFTIVIVISTIVSAYLSKLFSAWAVINSQLNNHFSIILVCFVICVLLYLNIRSTYFLKDSKK